MDWHTHTRSLRTRSASIVGLIMLFGLAAGLVQAQESDDVLHIRWHEDMENLDPPRMQDNLGTEIGYKIYDNLVTLRPGSFDEIIPGLAESWDITEDGLTYTFNLREGVQWHHGYGEVTAEDVRFSLLRHKDDDVGSVFSAEAEFIDDVEVVDEHTVRVHMERPYPGFLIEFAAYRPGFIVNEQALEDLGDRYLDQPVGSGPYVLEEWQPLDRITLTRNQDYDREVGQFERVEYIIIPDDAVFEVALQRGEVDIGYVFDPEVQQRLTEDTALDTITISAPRTIYLQLNVENDALEDVRVRKALWYALDRELLVDAILEGQGQTSDSVIAPSVFGHLDERSYEYDPERARELLAEAGYGDGLSLNLTIQPEYSIPDMAVAAQDMWRDVGIDVDVTQREWAQIVELRRGGDFDFVMGALARVGPDQFVTPFYYSEAIPYPNSSRYANPEMDELIEEARVTVDEDERREVYYEIQRLAQRDAPVIPVLNPVFVLAFQPELENVEAGALTVNVQDIELTE